MPRNTKKKRHKKNTAVPGATAPASISTSEPKEELLGAIASAPVSASNLNEELYQILQFLHNFCREVILSPKVLEKRYGSLIKIIDTRTGLVEAAVYEQTETGETAINNENLYTGSDPVPIGTSLMTSAALKTMIELLKADVIKNALLPSLSKNIKMSFLVSYLVLLMRKLHRIYEMEEISPGAFEQNKSDLYDGMLEIIAELIGCFPKEQLQLHMDALQWYHTAEFSELEDITEKNIRKLFDSALKTELPPLKLFLIRYILSPEKKSLLSPVHIFDLPESPDLNDQDRVLESLGLSAIDFDLFEKANGKKSITYPLCYHHQLLWMIHKNPHKNFKFIPHHENNISETLQIFCSVILKLIRAKGDICDPIYSKKDFFIPEEKTLSKRPTQDMKAVLHSLKNQNSFEEYKDKIEALIETEKSDYVKGFFYFLLGLYYRNQRLKKTPKSPLTTPDYYRRAARLDHPMLFKDAADIYMCHGKYQQTIECLQDWMQHFGSNENISDESKLSVENQIELCQQNIDQLDTQAKQEAQATKEQEEQAEKHFAELMHALSLKASVDQPSCTNNPVASAPEPLPTPQETPNQDELSLMDEAFGAQQMTAKELQQAQRNTTRSKKKKQTQKGAQAEQWGEDDDYRTDEVRSFMKQLSIHKDKGSALGEISYATEMKSKVSPQGKKKKYFYGRICERLAWAHIHRVEQSFSLLEPLSTKETERHLAIAEENLIESLHYFTNGSSRLTRTITPNQLETVICTFYTKNRNHHQSPLYRLRLRSIASSLGHLYNNKKKYTQSSPYEKRFASQFFNLKTTADYEYKKTMVNKTRSKINIMKQRMFDQFSQAYPKHSDMVRNLKASPEL